MSRGAKWRLGLLVAGIVGAALVVALKRDRASRAGQVLALVPVDVAGLVWVPRLAAAAEGVEAAARAVGLTRERAALAAGVARQLGFDPFDPEALRGHGIDPDGGVVAFTTPVGGGGTLGLRSNDPAALEQVQERRLERRRVV
ncbi:MAG: hypothetical protein D6729_06545, partial [Deltaproteobacteria bacterium]